MPHQSRRDFLRAAARTAGAATAMSILPAGIRNALAIPAHNATGTIQDVEHIVVLMQENRSFDHYFGSLRGVRGFGDKRALSLPNGQSVWAQPTAPGATSYVMPFHPGEQSTGMTLGETFIVDLAHDWNTTHQAWNQGLYNQWVPAKGAAAMAYLTREDLPFHYQLADAFTICDGYHCSVLGPTDPNRFYMWTGWVGNDAQGGGPVLDNTRLDPGFTWSTFPETLQSAGISWKVYQDVGNGLNEANEWGYTSNPFIGNYGDSALLYFAQYQSAAASSPLHQGALSGTNVLNGGTYFDQLKADVANGTLPQVSWIVAPQAFCEHPTWTSNYGAWYVDQILQILTSNPTLWSKTVFLINYDENDGYFDHVVPPFPAGSGNGKSTVDTINEFYVTGTGRYAAGVNVSGPYGLGPRVPMLVVSPWSRGGWVCSEVFDHTSVIRFIQKRFGTAANKHLAESNITPWRRAVCGDLTSAFNFATPNESLPQLPDTSSFVPAFHPANPPAAGTTYTPSAPTVQTQPTQEPGVRPARALPYELFVQASTERTPGFLSLRFSNTGTVGAVFLAYAADGSAPHSYTVEAGKHVRDQLALGSGGTYDYTILGPNGFLRRIAGTVASGMPQPEVGEAYDVANGNLEVWFENPGRQPLDFSMTNAYDPGKTVTRTVPPRGKVQVDLDLRRAWGWYDVSVSVKQATGFVRRLGGHVETGRPSFSDPLLGS
ncbi:phospholipase C [Burkholderia paludis]|uniref:phosphocholine-specific phospholipase C n=1 Tax=Burkholderia paludis TaxID=1506587 RepID=UPI0004DB8920|nr:phospholipase C, phosphocholine-specific [Burkholderia paludis]KFG98075.1 phospholipase C [Burkholderia paludis]